MTHPTEDTLNDYIERELSPAEQVRVATHLETCADCALVVAEFQQIVREASALGPIQPTRRPLRSMQAHLAGPERAARWPCMEDRRRVGSA